MTTINLGSTEFLPYFNTLPKGTQDFIRTAERSMENLKSVIESKFAWYVKNTKVQISEAGLDKVAGQISGDLIREGKKKVDGQGISKNDVKAIIMKNKFWTILWTKGKDILKPPAWLYWALGGIAVLAILVVATPYVKLGSQLLPRRR